MKLLIGIATYKRTEKLQRCLNSIFNSSYKDYEILIVADNNDVATKDYLAGPNMYKLWDVIVQPSQQFVIGAWNRANRENIEIKFVEDNNGTKVGFDGFIGLCDDVELTENALENAVLAHKNWFPDGDGVVGFKQDCPGYPEYTFKWYGQTLMGREFIERYKQVDYQICCPDYKHFFQDEEMFMYANSMNKFHPEESALLHHYHPSFIREEQDQTHEIVRFGNDSPKVHDMKVLAERLKKGYLWGRDFNLVGDL